MSAAEDTELPAEAEPVDESPQLSRDDQIRQLLKQIATAHKYENAHRRTALKLRIALRYGEADWQEEQAGVWSRKLRDYQSELADLTAADGMRPRLNQ